MKIVLKDPKTLQCVRMRKGYTQRALAERIGMSNVRISQLEKGKDRVVTVRTASALILELNCEWSDLFAFEE